MTIEGVLVGLLAILVGAGWAFAGLQLFTIILPIWAAFFGLIFGAQLGEDIFGQGFFATLLSWVIAAVFAIGFGLISLFWYYFAVTMAAGAVGYALGAGLMATLGIDAGILSVIVGLVVGGIFAVGTFALGVPAILIVFLSAVGGAAAVVNGVLILMGRIKLENLDNGLVSGLLTDSFIGVAAWVVIAAAAIWFQLRNLGGTVTAVNRSAYRL